MVGLGSPVVASECIGLPSDAALPLGPFQPFRQVSDVTSAASPTLLACTVGAALDLAPRWRLVHRSPRLCDLQA
eukprot:7677434-Pyramimonas_sp.AAC.1